MSQHDGGSQHFPTGDQINQLSVELKEVSDAIETKTERWFELSSILEG